MDSVTAFLLTISILAATILPLLIAAVTGLVGGGFAGLSGFWSVFWRTYLVALGIAIVGLGLIWGIGALGVGIYRGLT